MCGVKDLLVIGFSNGVLILLDTDKLEIAFSHKHFTKNDKAIDKLKVFHIGQAVNEYLTALGGGNGGSSGRMSENFQIPLDSQTQSSQTPQTLLFSLSDGLLSYHNFPKITLIDELVMEANIVDFQPYSNLSSSSTQKRSFLATVHRNKELKIFRLRTKRAAGGSSGAP
jgi:hypothetical protein